ncbi:MAG: zinc protease [Parcubacteria bacterium C7867-007]|nr:MAG: zinc protease [Parcubacteria bacterium C7867-007]
MAASIPAIEFVRELDGIQEYTLKNNGLRILLVPDDSVPVAGVMVTYHVGSRNEATGYTGATHLLEHLMFKGSERFNHENGNGIEDSIESLGGVLNATTWFDRTNYYSIVPSNNVHLPIEIEADRMRTARITEKDRASEMPIVRNEYERGENLPMEALDKAIWSAAFIAHPYHHSTIGWKSDIEGVSIERLNEFYNDFYWPNNATLTVAGRFETKGVLTLIKKEFGKHSKSPKAFPALYTEEPPQEGQRRAIVKRAGTNTVGVAYKIPNALHADIPALLILSNILDGDNTSRLYRAFIDTAKATSISTYCMELRDPALFVSYISLSPKTTHGEAEKVFIQELSKIQEKGVTSAELVRAKRAVRRFVAARRDGAYNLLSSLNEDLATGDWTRFVTQPEKMQKVTAADIKRVACSYFKEDQSTIGYFINTAS